LDSSWSDWLIAQLDFDEGGLTHGVQHWQIGSPRGSRRKAVLTGMGDAVEITYLHPDGTRSILEVPVGITVMEAAVDNDIDGIVGQCGGKTVCGTCHVFVDSVAGRVLPELEADEDDLLDYTAEPRTKASRLGCRLTVEEGLASLVVRLPETQC
jgi:2Fe-2S ferredoxin